MLHPRPPRVTALTAPLTTISTAEVNVAAAEVAIKHAVNARNAAFAALREGLTHIACSAKRGILAEQGI